MPDKCVCGSWLNVEHALTCACGGFRSLRHNEIRDMTASLLTEVCRNVKTKPELQPLTGETFSLRSANTEDNSRLGIRAMRFWGDMQPRIAEKSNQQYSTIMGMIRCRISFSLLRSAIMCMRGSQSSYQHPIGPSEMPADVEAHEGRVVLL